MSNADGKGSFVERLRRTTPSTSVDAPRIDPRYNNVTDDLFDVLQPQLSMMDRVKGVQAVAIPLDDVFRLETEEVVLRGLKGRRDDVGQLVRDLARGIFQYRAVPWLSLESTADRHAKRLSTMHPCYRETLVGFVCLELDVALKAVVGTARGGIFCDVAERDRFLRKVCDSRDWGPNGQRQDSELSLAAVKAKFPSFQTSKDLFGSDIVDIWKTKWRAAWTAITGADIQGEVQHVTVRRCDAKVVADVVPAWRVDIHDDDSSSGDVGALAREGEALCKRMLPLVPIPTSSWTPPPGRATVGYLLDLLGTATALATVFVAARSAGLVPVVDDDPVPPKKYATPRWIPFEPAVDDVSDAIFLGGGVAVGGFRGNITFSDDPIPPTELGDVVLRFSTTTTSTGPPSRTTGKVTSEERHHAEDLRRRASLYPYEVDALGLRESYAKAHAALHNDIEEEEQQRPERPEVLKALLEEILPDGYSRRQRMGRSQILDRLLKKPETADETSHHHRETVTLMNGDVYDGEWLFGRKHGKGIYKFTSGATYEGRWTNGTMTGIGFFTKDGERRIIRHSDFGGPK